MQTVHDKGLAAQTATVVAYIRLNASQQHVSTLYINVALLHA